MPIEQFIKRVVKQGMFESIGDGISIQDTNFKILYQNQIHKNMIGNHIGKFCYRAYEHRDHVCEGCPVAMSFQDGKIHKAERSSHDGKIDVEIAASLLMDATGKVVAGIEVVRDVTERKLAEKALQKVRAELEVRVQERTKELEEMNSALEVLLRKRENDKRILEENILDNMKNLILPYIEKLKRNRSMSNELVYLNIIETNLNEIVSPFSHKLSSNYLGFTPKEIQIANLIKDGKQDKDIMEILNISFETVKAHRKNVRRKLNIYGKRTNLRTKLLSLD